MSDERLQHRFRSLRIKLAVLVASATTLGALMTWVGLQFALGPTRTFPLVLVVTLAVTLLIARSMTAPLREMTVAAEQIASGSYHQRVRASSRDEMGTLARAFNQMASDLESAAATSRDLIANVAHELRTPIAALNAQLENLVDGVVDPTPAALKTSLAQTERLTRLVTYLLDLSRVQAGAAALKFETLQLGDYLHECAESVQMVDADKDLRFVVDVPSGLELVADGERLRQAIVNLILNAIRHSPNEGLIRVDAYAVGNQVAIEVADQGPGIAPEDRARVFDRFAQGRVTASGGTGIGLSIVRWAVELHGGTVSVVDARSTGATVRMVLPTRPIVVPTAPAQSESAQSESAQPDGAL